MRVIIEESGVKSDQRSRQPADSKPADEYEETLIKAAGMIRALP